MNGQRLENTNLISPTLLLCDFSQTTYLLSPSFLTCKTELMISACCAFQDRMTTDLEVLS